MDPNKYESILVYKEDTHEVVAMVPLKIGKSAEIRNGYRARIVMDTESAISRHDGRIFYKEEGE